MVMKKINIIWIVSIILLAASPAYAGWSTPVRISGPGHYECPQILARGDTLHVVYQDMNTYYKISYQRSTNGGLYWGPKVVLSRDSIETTFPRIIGSGNRLMALWKSALVGYYRYTIAYSISTNNGQSWSNPQNVINPGSPEDLYFAASSGTGLNICIVYDTYANDSMTFYGIRSTNFGQNWSAPNEIFRVFESGIPDQANTGNLVHLIWDGRFDLQHHVDIYYSKSIDGGLNWMPNISLSDTDQFHSQMPAICADSTSINCCWMDYKYSPYPGTGDILTRSSSDSGQTWGPERQATFDHCAWNSDIASNGDTIHIVWVDEGTGIGHRSIYYTQTTDNGATWSEPYWIDGTLDDSWDPVITVSNNHIYIIWGDRRPNPDSSLNGGLYISRFDPDNDAINENNSNNNIPDKLSLSAYPNPFNSSVTITYSNLKGGEIEIYDIQGKLIKTLKIEGGENGKIIWDASDALGNKVSSGEYFLKAQNGSKETGASQNSSAFKLMYLK
jgi:hypothetical protein